MTDFIIRYLVREEQVCYKTKAPASAFQYAKKEPAEPVLLNILLYNKSKSYLQNRIRNLPPFTRPPLVNRSRERISPRKSRTEDKHPTY